MENLKTVGRPRLNIDEKLWESEIKKYLTHKQSGVKTFQNLGIGKTSFYDRLSKMGVKRC